MNEKDQQPQQPEREQQPTLQPRIWVGSLADYNAGRLHGDWLDATVTDEELHDAVQRILASSHEPDAEEYGIFDYDEFGPFQVGEYEQLDVVARVARGIAEHGPAFAAYAQLHDADPDMLDSFTDSYGGEYDSPEDWARDVLHDGLETEIDRAVPDALRGYVAINYAGFARDAELSGDVHFERSPDGHVYVFTIP
ncbi:antirestriction protein ArdA [Gordonia cholesterolivorans]|uniref:Antirestriction protein n=1 Tax=Gordonia cholesterolivorans TaxID=559625 RepID=A0ABP5UXG4_9ACTN